MGKFNHEFVLSDYSEHFREYKCDDACARIDFLGESFVRVAVYKEGSKMLPTFCVCPDNEMPLSGRERLDVKGFNPISVQTKTIENKDCFTLPCGVQMEVDLHNFLLCCKSGGQILLSDRAPLSYNIDGEFGNGNYHYLLRTPDEKIFGLGDKGGKVNKSGRSFKIETADAMGYNAETSDPLYKHIPFYMCKNSIGCYGIFYDTSDTSYFDFGKEINNYYEPYKFFKTEDNALVYYLFFGSPLSVLKQFSRLCGKQAFPAKWSFDYCASTMAYTDAPDSEKQMNDFTKTLRKKDISCSGFYLSSGYTSIGNQRFVFNWNKEKFPDPEKFIKKFRDNKIELIPNIKPAFLVDHPMYKEIENKGLFIKNADGSTFVTQFWDGLGSYIDFTNKEAFDFWKHQVTEKLLDYGIKCTWNDNNEFDIKDCGALSEGFGNGKVNAERIRSVLTYLMVTASYQAQIERNPSIRPFLSTRSGNIGVRRMAQTWSGDNRTSFEDLKYCHNIGLTLSLSGLYFYGHDLGGFSGDMPSRELLLRWLQHGIFEPRFTIHSWNSDGSATMPWSYPDIMESVKEIMSQRKRLVPYLYSCAYKAVEFDEPMNSPMFLYYNDKIEDCESNSMLVGKDILVYFIFNEGEKETTAHLPCGDDWYLDGEVYGGGESVKLKILPEDKMPYFIRRGCVMPTDEGEYGFQSEENLVFTVYPVESGNFKSEFFSDDGESFAYLENDCVKLIFTVECDSDSVVVSYNNSGNMNINPQIHLCYGDNRKLIIK